MTFVPNREELAWAAGFFDGEGCALAINGKYLRLTVTQTGYYAPALLMRFKKAVGEIGAIYGPIQVPKKHAAKWNYQVDTFEKAQVVVAAIWTWLGPRKRDQIALALAAVGKHYATGPTHSAAMHRRWADPAFRTKMAKAQGKNNSFFGKKHSPETIAKMSAMRKAYYLRIKAQAKVANRGE